MTAPLPIWLGNPYAHANIDGRCLDSPDLKVCEACRWEAGARAVIARLRTDAFLLRRVGLQEPIQKLADEYEHELKGET